jgi:hypothetical protein
MSRKSAAVGTGAMALSPLVDMVKNTVHYARLPVIDNFFKILFSRTQLSLQYELAHH